MMPAQSIWMIRLSLCYLLCISLIGSLLLIHKAVPLHPALWALLPIHYEMAIWGWVVQFVMGTAYWMFPRYLKGSKRGSGVLGWLVVIFFNSGLWILLSPFILDIHLVIFRITGRLLIVGSVFLYAFLMWQRVVSYRQFESRTD